MPRARRRGSAGRRPRCPRGGTRRSTPPSRLRTRSAASGRPSERSYAAFQNPPWITTTTPRGGAVGQGELAELAGVVAVPERPGPRRAATGSSSPHAATARVAAPSAGSPSRVRRLTRPSEQTSSSVGLDDRPGLGAGRAMLFGCRGPEQVMPTRAACRPALSGSVAVSWTDAVVGARRAPWRPVAGTRARCRCTDRSSGWSGLPLSQLPPMARDEDRDAGRGPWYGSVKSYGATLISVRHGRRRAEREVGALHVGRLLDVLRLDRAVLDLGRGHRVLVQLGRGDRPVGDLDRGVAPCRCRVRRRRPGRRRRRGCCAGA